MRLIDADILMERILKRIESGEYHGLTLHMLEWLITVIYRQPTVKNVKSVIYGEWYYIPRTNHDWQCTACRKIYKRGYKYKFCPGCGANMEIIRFSCKECLNNVENICEKYNVDVKEGITRCSKDGYNYYEKRA